MPDQPSSSRVALAGSARAYPPQAMDKGPVDADERAEVTVVLRSPTSESDMSRILEEASAKPLAAREYMNREQLFALRGAESSDIERVKDFAAAHHLTVTSVDAAARSVSIEGTLKNLEQAFGVALHKYEAEGHVFRAASGPIHLPAEIAPAVTAVLGLDTRPAASPR